MAISSCFPPSQSNHPQLNVPLINRANLVTDNKLPFLENVPDIPHFPVLWIDLGADIQSVTQRN